MLKVTKCLLSVCLCMFIIVPTTFAAEKWHANPEKTLKLADSMPIGYTLSKSQVYFCGRVAELTNGRIKIEHYPGGILGMHERVLAENLASGALDISHMSSAALSSLVPAMSIFGLNYFVQNPGHLYRIVSSPVGKFLEAEAEKKGIKMILWYSSGMRNTIPRGKPVLKPEDLGGLKIRVMEDKMQIESWKAMGAVPVPIAFAEKFSAFQTGVVDALEGVTSQFITDKYYEVTQYYSLTGHMLDVCLIGVSLKTWNKLDKEAQNAIIQAANEQKGWLRGFMVYDVEKDLKWLRNKGVKINPINTAPLREKLNPIHEKYAPTLIGKELFEYYKSIPTSPEEIFTEKVYLYSE